MLMLSFVTGISGIVLVIAIIIAFGILAFISRFFRKVEQGQAIVRNGWGGTKVSWVRVAK